ncbi:MAG TPA: esterase-like activity of phytase family protein [Candidatus Binatia bacterium]|nr:esterase-like activity of phytase family protein [Candidatus Binatia bacterium]
MKIRALTLPLVAAVVLLASIAHAGPALIATGSISGTYEDLALETAGPLEDGVPGNRLGGIGSGLAYAGGNIFLALPDRGPNAKAYNAAVDDTTSYIARFHTLHMSLAPSDAGSPLPFTLTPMLLDTTLLSSQRPLVYGPGAGLGLGSGAPALNAADHTHYFTGRSDNFDPAQPSTNPRNARLDPEGIRVSRDGRSVFVSDEYGPYVYEFKRRSGRRVRAFTIPANLAVSHLSPVGQTEIDGNIAGRVANKGMEGLAITPSGKLLVGVMQAPLIQDGGKIIRIVTFDIATGATRQYAYALTTGSGVSEILAINEHEFLLDERDGKGQGDGSAAVVKQLFRVDLTGATDVSALSGAATLAPLAVPKTLFLDVVAELTAKGVAAIHIPAKLEGIAFGQDVTIGGAIKHTLYVSSDNDFLAAVADKNNVVVDNPNQFFVFAFSDAELPGFVPQAFKAYRGDEDDDRDEW